MANTYAPQSVGINQTNLQNGGWYNGRQFYNGQVGDPGVIINPEQQGAGQAVSHEVNQQTSVAAGLAPNANQNYIDQQTQQAPAVAPTGQSTAYTGGDTGATATGATGDLFGAGGSPATTLNLPQLYQSMYDKAGISDIEKSLTDKQNAYNDAQSKINDNPFLSEATRVGRIAKLTNDYNNDSKTVQDSLAMKKADIQTQLDIQTKQFDINSQAAQQALSTFNSLLSSGALENASGSDIAMITKSTGLSSQAIQSAISATKQKNTPTSIIQYDDGKNQGFAVVNTQTGAIISRQAVAGSTPKGKAASGQKNANGEKLDANGLGASDYQNYLMQDIKNKVTLKSLVQHYQQYIPIDTIYQLYSNNSPWNANGSGTKETLAQVKAGKYAD